MEIGKIVGANVKRHRQKAGISQEELAARIDKDQGYVSKLEAGQRNPTIATIQRIANALDVDTERLFANLHN